MIRECFYSIRLSEKKGILFLFFIYRTVPILHRRFNSLPVKGIFQPFELGGVTRLIRSAVKFWTAGN